MPTDGPPLPDPKARTLARGERRYRRTVGSPKTWARIIDRKIGPCRACLDPATNGKLHGRIQFHHLVARVHGGDDVPENIVPLCIECHDRVTRRDATASRALVESLSDAEYSYAIQRGGEGYFERAYGVEYSRS